MAGGVPDQDGAAPFKERDLFFEEMVIGRQAGKKHQLRLSGFPCSAYPVADDTAGRLIRFFRHDELAFASACSVP